MLTPDQIEARRKGIGGSDWGDILGIEPYGCPLRCWYTKRGIIEDYPLSGGVLDRGNKLEQIVADEYEEKTGRVTRKPGKPKRQDLPKWLLGLPDRMIVKGTEETPGVLECKTRLRWRLFPDIVAEGNGPAVIAQVQHYIWLMGWTWGVIATLQPDTWQFHMEHVEKDRDLLNLMRAAGDKFWQSVEYGPSPPRLDLGDKRCGRCQYRIGCWKEELEAMEAAQPPDLVVIENDELLSSVEELQTQNAMIKGAQEAADNIKARIKKELGQPTKAQIGRYKISYTRTVSHGIDTKELKKAFPGVAKHYPKDSVREILKITEVK